MFISLLFHFSDPEGSSPSKGAALCREKVKHDETRSCVSCVWICHAAIPPGHPRTPLQLRAWVASEAVLPCPSSNFPVSSGASTNPQVEYVETCFKTASQHESHINSDYEYHTESHLAGLLEQLRLTRQIQWGAQGWRFNHIHTVAPYSLNAQHHAQSDSVTQHRWGSPGPS